MCVCIYWLFLTSKARVDEWDFDSDGFVPYLDRAITLLTRLIGEVEQFESRMTILNCLSLIVERMDSLVNLYELNLSLKFWHQFKIKYLLVRLCLSLRK